MNPLISGRRTVTALLAALLLTFGLSAAVTPLAQAAAGSYDPTPTLAASTVAQFQGVWTTPPTNLSGGETTDAPMMGNGDVGVAVGGSINDQTFYVGKNDFFSTTTNAIEPLGRIVVAAPSMAGSSYHVVQNIAQAQVQGTYTLGGTTLTTTSWVSATENVFVTSFSLTGGGAQNIMISLQNGAGGTPAISTSGNDLDANVVAAPNGTGGPAARMAARTIGQTQSVSGSTLTLTMQPGTTSTLVVAVESSDDTSSYQSTADSMVGNLAQSDVSNLLSAHESWWQSYWAQSYVQIPNLAIEKSWYGSLYLLGSVSRAGKYAPGLWGNWIDGPMNWNGDYHTNYDYESPFYAALSTNHIAQMGTYAQPILQYESNAEQLASQNGYQGVLYPVGIGPNGMTTDSNLHNQKSNAAFLASDMVMEYEYTHDASYAATVYPFLKEVGLFWQNYLTLDSSGTYDIYNDAPQEDDPDPQTNSALSLGLVHLLFQGLIDMSTALNEDASTRTTWQNINAHLAPLPTTTENGQTVLSETSQGAGFVNDGNDIDIQAVYPGSQIGLDSSASLVQTAQNTVGQLTSAWDGGNAPATFYAAAARVGYNPTTIMSNLNDEATNQSYNNMAVHHNGGGVENLNVTTSGVDEMLLQSFQNDVKVFADWPANTTAKFGDLLAYGDFLISSSIANNTVQYVQAVSPAGGNYVFTNPWPGQSMEYYNNGTDEGTLSGTKITVSTTAGETIDLAPAGTSLATIDTELGQSLQGGGATAEGPYGGTPAAVPGTVQAENYDTGGQGSAYNVTSVTGTGNGYRPDGVDLETTTDTGGGYDLGWTSGGQWFKYTVNAATAGTYTVSFRVAAPSAVTDAFHLASASGASLSGNVSIPATGGWQNWTTVTATVTLPAGRQALTLNEDNGGWNVNDLSFAPASGGINPAAWYEVVNASSGLCASAASGGTANGTAVQQLACTGATSQLWQFVPVTGGYYEVLNENAQAAGESWNITGGVGATASGALLQLWSYGGAGNTNALFTAGQGSSGYYSFAADNSGLCIDTPGSSASSGVQLQQYACNGTGAQEFSLVQK
ncbi:MAG TPA: carbohydrate-binding protein [Trebonia sp.]|nr:carbohydrate-binding protein [Trebonia sp.]